jgi:hypothetical protein
MIRLLMNQEDVEREPLREPLKISQIKSPMKTISTGVMRTRNCCNQVRVLFTRNPGVVLWSGFKVGAY